MTHQEILTAAIEKAIAGGFQLGHYEVKDRNGLLDGRQQTEPYVLQSWNAESTYTREIAYQVIIYNHDFAKALWGEQKLLENGEYPPEVILYEGQPMWHPWKHHLQRMVLADDPIAYLGANI